ncbi:MAG: precorrin-6A/cobalt-precorrin-6A reductase [Pseudomonadota bacterium]
MTGRMIGQRLRLLILGGTPESQMISAAISNDRRVATTASLARVGRKPKPMGVPTRIGTWRGKAEFQDWVRAEQFDAILDATDAYSPQMSEWAHEISVALGVDFIQFLPHLLTPRSTDNWSFLNGLEDAANEVADHATVFMDLGVSELGRLPFRDGQVVYSVDQDDVTRRVQGNQSTPISLRPINTLVTAADLFMSLGVDAVVALNSGTHRTTVVLDAARELGIPVGMIRRPPQIEGPKLTSISEALAWVRRRI